MQILQDLLKEEEAVDAEVRKKISSQKKEILEGSEEWDVLYRKYYAEEMRRMGVVHLPSRAITTSSTNGNCKMALKRPSEESCRTAFKKFLRCGFG